MTIASRIARLAIALAIAGGAYSGIYRPLGRGRGATAAEIVRPMKGDDVVAAPSSCVTRALGIAAPLDRISPWTAQVGERGVGWYGYDLIDNGARESSRRILPRRQYSVSNWVPAGKGPKEGEPAKNVVPPWWMLVASGGRRMSWTWELIPGDEGHTRLVSRICVRGGWTSPLAAAAIDVGDLLMMRQMMNGVRDRAEGRPIRSFASLTAELLLWVACFAGFWVAEVRVTRRRRWRLAALVAIAASVVTIALVISQPPVWIDALGLALILAGLTGEQLRSGGRERDLPT